MSWRIRVEHRTGFRYAGPVSASYNEARMTPQSGAGQLTVEARLELQPAAGTFRYRDYWGTLVHAFDIHLPHDELSVTATAVVETAPTPEPPMGSWDLLDNRDTADRCCEFLTTSKYVPADSDLAAVGAGLRKAPTPLDAIAAGSAWVHEHMEYVPGATTVATAAPEAYRERRGVCQDFAHVLLAILRSAGVPARYASGYLHPDPDADIGVTVAGQSHAWVEAWSGEWSGTDPTNGGPVGERHVLVARGRDYADVTPLKGIYNGGPAEDLGVDVTLTRLR
ncbi:MAG TPA: transglutaminase family protein [Acidimicrobiales bacterium]|jgi:transglutaminase-like putative cysteine protease|nr:transglutaminase family protein [Acidimicrobiales bacterium]